MVNKAWMKGKGEGKTHIEMTSFVHELMVEMGYIDVRERYPVKHRNPKSDNEWIASEHGVYHEFDVRGAQILHDQNGEVYYVATYVEIDGEWHDNKIQKNKDKTAEQMLKEYYEDLFLKRSKFKQWRLIRLKKALVIKAMKKGNTESLKEKIALEVSITK